VLEEKPPLFVGRVNLDVVDKWIMDMEMILGVLGCIKEQKVVYATNVFPNQCEEPKGGRVI
ncbi:hypothetical protein CR513_28496, partial [Mucuna pruriens]